MRHNDTIAAIASPAGPAARIILRLSGPQAHAAVRALCPALNTAAPLNRCDCALQNMRFPVLVLLFAEGASYTGEAAAEMHLPGNPLLAHLTLQALFDTGTRPAEPGEFTARAFFHGRMDLTEAEGVAATIAASNQRQLDAARRLQAGELTSRLRPLTDALTETLALIEAGIDFSEEDIQFLTRGQIQSRARAIVDALGNLLRDSARLETLAHEPQVVLCGRPNAGKSTLLNALAGHTRAVVSPTAGTTRDLLQAELPLPRGMAHLIDTAGLEAWEESGGSEGLGGSEHVSSSPTTAAHVLRDIARQMQQRAESAIAGADVLVLVCDSAVTHASPSLLARPADLVVWSKADQAIPHTRSTPSAPAAFSPAEIAVSAATGLGMPELRAHLDHLAFGERGSEQLALNGRHQRQIALAQEELRHLANALPASDELVAEHLRSALDALGEISGIVSPDEVLGKVFAAFCIGK